MARRVELRQSVVLSSDVSNRARGTVISYLPTCPSAFVVGSRADARRRPRVIATLRTMPVAPACQNALEFVLDQFHPRTGSRIALSIGSNHLSKSRPAASSQSCMESHFVVWPSWRGLRSSASTSGDSRLNTSETTRPSIPTNLSTAPCRKQRGSGVFQNALSSRECFLLILPPKVRREPDKEIVYQHTSAASSVYRRPLMSWEDDG
jgi:hypothetical protein